MAHTIPTPQAVQAPLHPNHAQPRSPRNRPDHRNGRGGGAAQNGVAPNAPARRRAYPRPPAVADAYSLPEAADALGISVVRLKRLLEGPEGSRIARTVVTPVAGGARGAVRTAVVVPAAQLETLRELSRRQQDGDGTGDDVAARRAAVAAPRPATAPAFRPALSPEPPSWCVRRDDGGPARISRLTGLLSAAAVAIAVAVMVTPPGHPVFSLGRGVALPAPRLQARAAESGAAAAPRGQAAPRPKAQKAETVEKASGESPAAAPVAASE